MTTADFTDLIDALVNARIMLFSRSVIESSGAPVPADLGTRQEILRDIEAIKLQIANALEDYLEEPRNRFKQS